MTAHFQNKGANIQKDGTLVWAWIRNCYKFNKEEIEIEIMKHIFYIFYKNILRVQTSYQSLAHEIQNRTIWTIRKHKGY